MLRSTERPWSTSLGYGDERVQADVFLIRHRPGLEVLRCMSHDGEPQWSTYEGPADCNTREMWEGKISAKRKIQT
jgi:hypothetical protein